MPEKRLTKNNPVSITIMKIIDALNDKDVFEGSVFSQVLEIPNDDTPDDPYVSFQFNQVNYNNVIVALILNGINPRTIQRQLSIDDMGISRGLLPSDGQLRNEIFYSFGFEGEDEAKEAVATIDYTPFDESSDMKKISFYDWVMSMNSSELLLIHYGENELAKEAYFNRKKKEGGNV